MPKQVVAKYIYQGQYEFVIRLCTTKIDPITKQRYMRWFLPVKDYTLDEAKIYRNNLLVELEEKGWRNTKRKMENSKTIGMK